VRRNKDAPLILRNEDSPCILICRVENGHCIGCYRTLDEIRYWSISTTIEKASIKAKIKLRKHRDTKDEN